LSLDDIVHRLDECLPGFAPYLRSEECLFRADSVHGAFAAFSQLVRDRDPASVDWPPIARLVNELVEAGGSLANAVCTCFLENLARTEHPLRPLLASEAARYWDAWQ
jgi:hypothetical protein